MKQVFIAVGVCLSCVCSAESFLITGARVADGTGAPLRSAAVRVDAGVIQAVGNLKPRAGEKVIRADGLVLAPGFIDTHNHSTDAFDQNPGADSQVSQGITTMLLGQDGSSPVSIADYLRKRRDQPAAVNFQIMAGHATIRQSVMGTDFRRPAKPEEIAQMQVLVERAMQEGAVGLSTGLEYEVGSYSTTEEVIALAKVASRYKGIYVSHVRDESDNAFDSFREVIRIGEEARLPCISRISSSGAPACGVKRRKRFVDRCGPRKRGRYYGRLLSV